MMRLLYKLGWLVLLLGLLLQIWLKDHDPRWAIVFYGMPKPCLLALSLVLCLWPKRRRRQRWPALAASVGLALWWVSASWCVPQIDWPKDQASSPENPPLKILYWNLCRPVGLDQEMVDLVKQTQPDLAVFLEVGGAGSVMTRYSQLLPDYRPELMQRGIMRLSRLKTEPSRSKILPIRAADSEFVVAGHGPEFPVIVADLYPHVSRPRKPQIDAVFAQTFRRPDAIVIGDFNTPLESVHLGQMRQHYVEAFEVAGFGFKETWPCGLPLLSIDHIWVGPDWQVLKAEKFWRLTGSDHAALLVSVQRKVKAP
jgi:endonuclease/exonuclease/phosphatase (EEP) superfamily protein YafD